METAHKKVKQGTTHGPGDGRAYYLGTRRSSNLSVGHCEKRGVINSVQRLPNGKRQSWEYEIP